MPVRPASWTRWRNAASSAPFEGAKPRQLLITPRAVGADAERHLCPARAARRRRASLICLYAGPWQGAPRLQNKCLRCIRVVRSDSRRYSLESSENQPYGRHCRPGRARRGAAASQQCHQDRHGLYHADTDPHRGRRSLLRPGSGRDPRHGVRPCCLHQLRYRCGYGRKPGLSGQSVPLRRRLHRQGHSVRLVRLALSTGSSPGRMPRSAAMPSPFCWLPSPRRS